MQSRRPCRRTARRFDHELSRGILTIEALARDCITVKRPQAPEIFQKPITTIDVTGLPPRGSPDFDQAVIARYALEYASKGWNAVVTVDNEFVRVVAIPRSEAIRSGLAAASVSRRRPSDP